MTVRRYHVPAILSKAVVATLTAAVLALTALAPGAAQEAPATPPIGEVTAPFLTLDPLPEGAPRADGPLRVVATTGIVADFVRQVGGPRVEVATILPANADPHDYEPAPADLVAVEDADVVFTYGLGLDEWADDLIENAGTDAAVAAVSDGVSTLSAAEGEEHEGEGDDHGDVDPHAWFDPTLVKTMTQNVAATLTAADPEGGATYADRTAAYGLGLDRLDAAIAERVALVPPERRKLVTNHDALGYFAARYGFAIVGTVIPGLDTRAEPSAEDVDALLETIEAEGVTAVFAENTTSPTLAERLAEEAGVAVVDTLYTDSLGEPGSGADTYFGLMQTDTAIIVNALT